MYEIIYWYMLYISIFIFATVCMSAYKPVPQYVLVFLCLSLGMNIQYVVIIVYVVYTIFIYILHTCMIKPYKNNHSI